MPERRKSKKGQQISGPGAVILLLLIAGLYIYQSWREGQGEPLPGGAVVSTATAQEGAPAPVNPAATATLSTGPAVREDITIWFSDPLADLTSGGPETNLVDAINGAQRTVDMAIYNLSLPNVGDALLAAQQRGVQVRLVMESEAMDRSVPTRLAEANIPIVGDQREGLMHNKFTIIDGQTVFTGSMNYTSTSFYKDFNNLVRIRSAKMAQNYQTSFDEMFTGHQFGNDKEANTPYPRLTVGQTPVEVYFLPDDGAARQVAAELQKANKSIDVLAYSFTLNELADAIQERGAKGVQVRAVFDGSQVTNTGGEYEAFKDAGFDVRIDGISGLMHNKVIIIDGAVVITGSYNFSNNAERNNDENLLILRDPAIASKYLQHFEQVYGSSQ